MNTESKNENKLNFALNLTKEFCRFNTHAKNLKGINYRKKRDKI